ncbi:hypothetical protein RI065_00045 [Mycoplasmatota bacterium zrk1]
MELKEVVAKYLESTGSNGRIIISFSGNLYLGRDALNAGDSVCAVTDLKKSDVLPKIGTCGEFTHHLSSDIDLRDDLQRKAIINTFSDAAKLFVKYILAQIKYEFFHSIAKDENDNIILYPSIDNETYILYVMLEGDMGDFVVK